MPPVTPPVVRRVTSVLFASQCLSSAAFIAGATVNPIISAQLGGLPALAGLPGTLILLGGALGAYPAGLLGDRVGRRLALTLGFVLGLVGMLLAGWSMLAATYPGFLLGMLLVGFARGSSDQSRFAAAEVHVPARRARALSLIVFGGTAGAVLGPALVAPAGNLAATLGLNTLAGPIFGSALLFALAGLLIALLLRPDPRDLSRQLALAEQGSGVGVQGSGGDSEQPGLGHWEAKPDTPNPEPDTRYPESDTLNPAPRSLTTLLHLPAAQLAVAATACGQMVMVFLMGITSLHMTHHDHGLGDVSLVISAHTLGMFGLSMLTGPLADRLGRAAVIGTGALLLAAGALLAPLSLATPALALALFLIGLGWNFCYIAGSSLLSDTLTPAERGSRQGASDLLAGLCAAVASLGSGVAFASIGFGGMALLGAAVALLPLGLLLRARGTAAPAALRGEIQ